MIVHKVNHTNLNEFPQMIKDNCIVLFFHPQCPHCLHLNPIWEKMKQNNLEKNVNIVEVNGQFLSQLEHPIVNDVRGFPQIIHVNNGEIQNEFIKEPNLNNLNEYLRENSDKSLPKKNQSKKNKSKKNKPKKNQSKKNKSKKNQPKKNQSKKNQPKKNQPKKNVN
jgi:thiol-disulfide isomerase/thioredoxin